MWLRTNRTIFSIITIHYIYIILTCYNRRRGTKLPAYGHTILSCTIDHWTYYCSTYCESVACSIIIFNSINFYRYNNIIVSSRRSRQGSQCSDDLLLRLLITCYTNKLYDKNIFKMPNNLKRKRLSGSQYKRISKAKKEREEQLNKKTEKLYNYFKLKVSVHFITIVLIVFLQSNWLFNYINIIVPIGLNWNAF